jgi:hypothetical protein
MTIVVSSRNFVKAGSLPVLPINISAGRAYDAFITSDGSALVVQDNSLPLYYITAHFLNAAIGTIADPHGFESATIRPITFYLSLFLDKNDGSFRANINERVHGMTTVPEHLREITVEPVAPIPLRFDEEEPESKFKVHVVHNSTGQPQGYYFTEHPFVEMTRTPPVTYTCSLDEKHNSGPDSGTN